MKTVANTEGMSAKPANTWETEGTVRVPSTTIERRKIIPGCNDWLGTRALQCLFGATAYAADCFAARPLGFNALSIFPLLLQSSRSRCAPRRCREVCDHRERIG